MIDIANHSGWYLDDNGVNVVASEGKHVVDLHADCEVTSAQMRDNQIVIDLTKNAEYTEPSIIRKGQVFKLILNNISEVALPDMEYPTEFEGIYDYDGKSCTLSLGNDWLTLNSDDKLELLIEAP